MGDRKCRAFEKIPEDILLLERRHDRVLEGQIGSFVFTPKERSQIHSVGVFKE